MYAWSVDQGSNVEDVSSLGRPLHCQGVVLELMDVYLRPIIWEDIRDPDMESREDQRESGQLQQLQKEVEENTWVQNKHY